MVGLRVLVSGRYEFELVGILTLPQELNGNTRPTMFPATTLWSGYAPNILQEPLKQDSHVALQMNASVQESLHAWMCPSHVYGKLAFVNTEPSPISSIAGVHREWKSFLGCLGNRRALPVCKQGDHAGYSKMLWAVFNVQYEQVKYTTRIQEQTHESRLDYAH